MITQDLSKFDKLKADVMLFVQPTALIVVKDPTTNIQAQEHVKTISLMKKRIDLDLAEMIAPYKDFVSRATAYAKEIKAPLEDAEKEIKLKQVVWADEDLKHRQEEIRKIEIQRQEAQKKAEAEMIRLAAEAEKIRKQEALEIQKQQESEQKKAEEKYKKDQEVLKAFGRDDESIRHKAESERIERNAKFQRERAENQAKAEQDWVEAQVKAERESAERNLELKRQEAALISAKPKNTKQVPSWRVVDFKILPENYKMADTVQLGKDIRGGVRSIAGVEIVMVTQSAAV